MLLAMHTNLMSGGSHGFQIGCSNTPSAPMRNCPCQEVRAGICCKVEDCVQGGHISDFTSWKASTSPMQGFGVEASGSFSERSLMFSECQSLDTVHRLMMASTAETKLLCTCDDQRTKAHTVC